MTKCKGCGNQFNKGALAFILTKDGLKGARVCQKCAGGGVTIVATHLAPVVEAKGKFSKDERAILREALKPIIANLEAQVKASQYTVANNSSCERDFINGMIEAKENMIVVLKNAAKESS